MAKEKTKNDASVDIKLVIADANSFTSAISDVNKLIDETNIIVTPTHVEVIAMDLANVSMIIFKMQKSEFVEYTGEGSFGIKLSQLKQVLSRGNKDSVLTLTIANNQLKVSFVGKTKKEFTLPILDLELKAQKIPELTFGVEVSIDASELREVIADAAVVSDSSCEFKVENNSLSINAKNDANSKMIGETKALIKVLVADKANCAGLYSLEYLNKMISNKLSKSAKLFLSSEYPLKLLFENDKGTVSFTYILAPRINND